MMEPSELARQCCCLRLILKLSEATYAFCREFGSELARKDTGAVGASYRACLSLVKKCGKYLLQRSI